MKHSLTLLYRTASRQRDPANSGTSTIEALVALALLGIIGSSLTHTLAQSTGLRASSAGWLRASEVALSVVELIHADAESIPVQAPGFEHTWTVNPLNDHPGLLQYQVVVRWRGREERELTLEGLTWGRP